MRRPARSRGWSAIARSSPRTRSSSGVCSARRADAPPTAPSTTSRGVHMSSHREAPGISKDPVADSTDLYAFTSPDHPETVTLIANYIPLEGPDGGPNFYNFGDDVLYEINITSGGSVADA